MTEAFDGVRIPGSTSNIGPGFDCLGCALAVYLEVFVGSGNPSWRVEAAGVDADKMPRGEENLIVKVLRRVAERRGRTLAPCTLRVRNQVPLGRGLGSSSTAILAGVSCYEILTGERLALDEILDYAWEFEPHADNLAAGLLGGFTITATAGGSRPSVLKLPVPGLIAPVLVIPDFEVPTRTARAVLPDSYSRSDVVFNLQRTAQLIGALATGQLEFLAEAMKDRVHQPYRASLVPGLEQVLALKGDGLYGVALSGAGPTVLALAEPRRADEVGARVAGVFGNHGVKVRVEVSRIDTAGRQFLEASGPGEGNEKAG
jgi:homoserine kinase